MSCATQLLILCYINSFVLANGGDCEIIDSSPGGQANGVVQQDKETTTTVKGRFKKGHRRAYSMPNAGRDKAVLVVADDTVRVRKQLGVL